MKPQTTTGKLTEYEVQKKLTALGLKAEKPVPDRGVDLDVYDSATKFRKVCIQVKGRGKEQKNKKYRWFQLRTTQKQRESAISAGLDVSEAWKKKIDLCDFFILVSLHFNEHWVFPRGIIREVIEINKLTYGNRAGWINGLQVEIDLDVFYDGKTLVDKYQLYRDNYALIKSKFSA